MNIIEVTEKFPTELDAIRHFEKARWGKKLNARIAKHKMFPTAPKTTDFFAQIA